MAPIEPRIPDDEVIASVEDAFDRWIIGGIEAVAKSEGVSLAFVLIACAIDYLTGFWKGGESKGKDYIAFLAAHPDFSSKYNPSDVYQSLRCGLVHNFTIHGGQFGLTHNDPLSHLSKAKTGHIILNLENFFSDFKKLKESVFNEAKSNTEAQSRFIKRYRDLGFVLYRSIPF